MTLPLWQRFANLSPEAKQTLHDDLMEFARKLGREGREREEAADPTGWKRVAARLTPETIDENDYDAAYHRGSL